MSTIISSSTTTPTKPVVKLNEFTPAVKGKLIITPEFKQQIDYLHAKVGSVEWCGMLFYTILEGDFTDYSKLVIRPDDIFLMDIGSSAHTAATVSQEDLMEMYEKIPDAETGKKYGLIHTHHTMSTFFSGTDTDELNTNTHLHNYYLSLIVNFSGVYCAKIAFIAEVEKAFKFKNTDDTPIQANSTEKIIVKIDLDIVIEKQVLEVPEYISARFLSIDEKRKKAIKTYSSTQYPTVGGLYPDYGVREGGQVASNPTNAGAYSRTNIGFNRDTYEDDDDWGGYSSNTKRVSQDAVDWEEEWYAAHGFQPKGKDGKKEEEQVLSTKTNEKGQLVLLKEPKARDLVKDWLYNCMDIISSKKAAFSTFLTVREGLAYFESFFKNKTKTTEFGFFMSMCQDKLEDTTKLYSPQIVRQRFVSLMSEYIKEFPITREFMEAVEGFPAYMLEASKAKAAKQ